MAHYIDVGDIEGLTISHPKENYVDIFPVYFSSFTYQPIFNQRTSPRDESDTDITFIIGTHLDIIAHVDEITILRNKSNLICML